MNQMDVKHQQETLAKMREMNRNHQYVGFYMKLCNMTERVKAFNQTFCNRQPYYVENFLDRK